MSEQRFNKFIMIKSIAVIDIGTNSIKFCIAKSNGMAKPMLDSVHVTRIGENFQQSGQISPSAMERNIKKINELCIQAQQYGVSEIIAIGTMILRNATNSDVFIQKVKSLCGIHIHVLSGDEEASLSYLAAILSVNHISGNIFVLDTGGGSTELVYGKNRDIQKCFSFNIGAVILTEAFDTQDIVSHHEIDAIYEHIQNIIHFQTMPEPVNHLIGSCGAVTSMASVKYQLSHYDPEIIHGSRLTRKEVQHQISLLASKSRYQREKIPGIQKGRGDIALAGACILDQVMSSLQCDQIIVCDRGLRYGLINEVFRTKHLNMKTLLKDMKSTFNIC